MIEGVGGLEAHVLFALDMGMPAEKFGRIHHLPAAQLGAVIDGLRARRHRLAPQARPAEGLHDAQLDDGARLHIVHDDVGRDGSR
jgi:hypothetical protein